MSNIISKLQQWELPLARTAIFVVYGWFGVIKFLGQSPATPLVHALFDSTLAWLLPFGLFYSLFAAFEILIGLLFLIRGWERLSLSLLVLHLITTTLPLFVLPHHVWQSFLIPTLEGQYIIKNILLLSAGVVIGAHALKR